MVSPHSQKDNPISDETEKPHNTYGHNDGKDKRKLEIIDEHPNEESAEDIKTSISKISHPTDPKS